MGHGLEMAETGVSRTLLGGLSGSQVNVRGTPSWREAVRTWRGSLLRGPRRTARH